MAGKKADPKKPTRKSTVPDLAPPKTPKIKDPIGKEYKDDPKRPRAKPNKR